MVTDISPLRREFFFSKKGNSLVQRVSGPTHDCALVLEIRISHNDTHRASLRVAYVKVARYKAIPSIFPRSFLVFMLQLFQRKLDVSRTFGWLFAGINGCLLLALLKKSLRLYFIKDTNG